MRNDCNLLSTDDTAILQLVRAKLANGALPRSGTIQLWGGTGRGLPCDACERPVKPNHAEIAAEVDADEAPATTLRLHPHCYSIWQAERSR